MNTKPDEAEICRVRFVFYRSTLKIRMIGGHAVNSEKLFLSFSRFLFCAYCLFYFIGKYAA